MDLLTILAIVGALPVLWGLVVGAVRFWRWLVRLWDQKRHGIPRRTVRVVFDPHQCWWGVGKRGELEATQIAGRFSATNITNRPVWLLATYLERPRAAGQVIVAAVNDTHEEPIPFGHYPIRPGDTVRASCDFFLTPPIHRKGKDLRLAIVLIDQYQNEHRYGGNVFRAPGN